MVFVILVLVSLLSTLNRFHRCSGVAFRDFEQVSADWGNTADLILWRKCNPVVKSSHQSIYVLFLKNAFPSILEKLKENFNSWNKFQINFSGQAFFPGKFPNFSEWSFLKKICYGLFFIRDSLLLLRVLLYGILCFRKLTGPHQRCIQNHASEVYSESC